MKIAFLVLAARSPLVLKYVIKALASENASFFVHVDKKVDESTFWDALSQPNVYKASDRYPVFWGGFNMVLAEIGLLRQALAHGDYQRFVLLSDNSFPLKRSEAIFNVLASDRQMMTVQPSEYFRWRYDNFYFFDSDATNPQHREVQSRQILLDCLDGISKLADLRKTGKAPLPTIYKGSQWWAITRDAAKYILEEHESDLWRQHSFQFSCIPDEHYFQTIIGSANKPWVVSATPMYTDFSRLPAPHTFSNINDLAQGFQSDCLFARKIANDENFLEQLYETIKN